MMAAALTLGACGPYVVVPVCASALVWITFLLGKRIGGPWTGVVAATLIATSPIVLFQSVWPMSDVPAGLLWTAALFFALGSRRRDVAASGIVSAAALIVRPNLPLLPVVLFARVVWSAAGRERVLRGAIFLAAVAPAVLFIAVLNATWYGAITNSGYGAAREIYSLQTVLPNLRRYPVWLWTSQSPMVAMAALPLIAELRGRGDDRRAIWIAIFILATLVSYLVYFAFEEWWYLRFLLPAIPAVLVLAAGGLVHAARWLRRPWGYVAVVVTLLVAVTYTSRFIRDQVSFDSLRDGERRYADVGEFVRSTLPPNAVVLSVQQSGSVRFYSGRLTVRWDLIDRDWTPRAAAELERLGLHPYMVLEDFETAQMRSWFALADAPLPWPLVARMREQGVSVYDLASAAPPASPVSLESGITPRCGVCQALSISR